MKTLLLFFAALPLVAGDPPGSLAIFLDFPKNPTPKALQEMKHEVRDLLAPSGLSLHWRAVQENRGTESFDHLVVVRFKGGCLARPAPLRTDEALPYPTTVTLASTAVRNGRVLPYSEVDCDQIRGSLGSRISAFGRALGVVVAHEVKHVLENTVRHAKAGWMRQSLDWKDLTRRSGRQSFLPQ